MVFLVKLISYLPFRLLMVFSDILYFTGYHIIGYRRKVVRENLINAFPDYTNEKIAKIEKKFYRNLCDYVFESLKFVSMNNKDLKKHTRFVNSQFALDLANSGVPTLSCATHYFNWEWALHAGVMFMGRPIDPIYQKLKNQSFNKLIYQIRSRNGCLPIEKDEAVKKVVKHVKEGRHIAIVADQSPPMNQKDKVWVNFFGREVPYYMGIEVFVKLLKMKPLFVKIKKPRRGFYEISYEEFGLDQDQTYKKGDWIKAYSRKLEEMVREEPSLYLWSHRRWKHARTISAK